MGFDRLNLNKYDNPSIENTLACKSETFMDSVKYKIAREESKLAELRETLALLESNADFARLIDLTIKLNHY